MGVYTDVDTVKAADTGKSAATANTGGGGGGGGNTSTSGNVGGDGASGIIVARVKRTRN